MAPVFGYIVYVCVLVAAGIMGLILGGAGVCCLVKGARNKSLELKAIGAVLLLICFAGAWFLFRPLSVEEEAARIVTLPPEAKIIRVESGDWAGDGSVEFKLPQSRPVKVWLDIVWKMNIPTELRKPGVYRSSDEGDYQELFYDSETQVFTYVAVLNS